MTRKLLVGNTGTGYLTVRVVTPPGSFSAQPAKLTIGSRKQRVVFVTFRPTRAGLYRGSVFLKTDAPMTPAIAIAIRGTGRR